ncbi:hypothetical protein N781_08905 [Pontibacillus halophilus JSM 076056 = DSM 19796]|uniref:DNA mismatch repair MutH/Type II restriction enzyme Sau3AI domain-containing protein n=1 Tax=Pontibacillus halophilus JSM 076056 = DSM 19796 TaxID=1385510 RepID=A0A0A5G9J6_9BACI|nr:Sau3AI family type II restriction endonuclease [Pontibacillus halophilus]KGX89826.1 hypothetical protein N781_08905 [Pontibacillus halophilus JSM 076056 = DSM 19796]
MSQERFTYDYTSPTSIEEHAKKLENLTFREALDGLVIREDGNKGGLGRLVEEGHFGYNPNNTSGPDFEEAGVELKTTPYVYKTKKKAKAKERLVLNMINFNKLPHEDFETSSFWKKNQLLLLIFYLYQSKEEIANRLDYKITHAQLFQFPDKDLEIIKQDWEKIMKKVKEGKAHELSEGDTNYLGACTKGANAKDMVEQPYSEELAMRRAFSLKPSYMTTILNDYILAGKRTYKESIVGQDELDGQTLEEYILNQLSRFVGMTEEEIMNELGIEIKKSQNLTTQLASKMLRLESDIANSEEFIKANIKLKNIRVTQKGRVKESMSFPAFKYKEIVDEEWETSTLREMFLNTRYLFVVFQYNDQEELVFKKAMFWNIPHNDLELDVREVWDETVERIKSGKADQLPGSSENPVAHVRPHARNKQDTYETPQGQNVVKKSFWLNNTYIAKQIGY